MLKNDLVDLVEGRNAVLEALESNQNFDYIMVSSGQKNGSINKIIAIAKEKGIVIKEEDRRKLDKISETGAHQGVIAAVSQFKYSDVDDILKNAEKKKEAPFIIILDEIEDPHNFGAIVRTAEVCGVHGIIIPKRRNASVTSSVYKTSAGAVEYMPIARVTNLSSTVDYLKEKNIWIYGADMDADGFCYDYNYNDGTAIIIGNEGKGISHLLKSKCDFLIKIPMKGRISSLNASVAAGIMMYEVLKRRSGENKK